MMVLSMTFCDAIEPSVNSVLGIS